MTLKARPDARGSVTVRPLLRSGCRDPMAYMVPSSAWNMSIKMCRTAVRLSYVKASASGKQMKASYDKKHVASIAQ